MVPFYMRSGVYTMPEFLERRFSPAARWVLSVISLVAYVLTKIAVGIFAGGVVFGIAAAGPAAFTPRPALTFNSFWIGSVAVVVLTGLYTVLGGMRAVAYTEAVQTAILVIGSLLLTIFGLWRSAAGASCARRSTRRCSTCGSRSCPPASRAPGRRSRRPGRDGLVLQPGLSVAGHAVLRADHRPLVLVHRPVHRAAHARRQGRARGPPRHDLRRLPQAAAGLHLHRPRHDRLRAGAQRHAAGAGAARRRRRRSRARRRRRRRSR